MTKFLPQPRSVVICMAVAALSIFLIEPSSWAQSHVRSRELKPLLKPKPQPTPEPTPAPAANEAIALPSPTPTPDPGFDGKLEGSTVVSSGNTNTRNLGLAGEINYLPLPWRFHLKGAYISNSEQGSLTAERLNLEFRSRRDLTARSDVFFDTYYLNNRFAGFVYQITPELGYGYEWILSDSVQLRTEAALGSTFEKTTDDATNTFPTGRVGFLFALRLSENSAFSHETSFLPSLREDDEWRLRSETILSADVTSRLALKASYKYEYNNKPVPGKTAGDATTTSAFVFKF